MSYLNEVKMAAFKDELEKISMSTSTAKAITSSATSSAAEINIRKYIEKMRAGKVGKISVQPKPVI